MSAHKYAYISMPLAAELPTRLRRPAMAAVGSGIVGAAAILSKNGSSTLGPLLPSAPPGLGSMVVPFVSLLALAGPTGLTFPCWVSDGSSPGARAWRWLRGRFPN
jgi:hypothetical protein